MQQTISAQQIRRIDGSRIGAQSLDTLIVRLMREAQVSGAAVSIFNGGRPVYQRTFGLADVQRGVPLTDSSELYAASFAKAVFAYIAMQLVQEGRIALDTPLVSYLDKDLPDYKIPGWNRGYQDLRGDDRYRRITARMCLTHTTGFPNWRWFEADRKLKFRFDPGTRYSYSGEGLYLLQFVLEQITGEGLESLAQKRVFTPLGMKGTSFVWQSRFNGQVAYGHSSAGVPYELMKWKEASAGGSMTTTAADYTRFFAALVRGKGLSKRSFGEMTRLQVRIRSRAQFGPLALTDSSENDAIRLGYGLGVGVFDTPHGRAFFKEGHDDGWGHYSVAFPDKGIGMFIMTNNDNGEGIFRELLERAIGDVYTPWRWENYIPYNYGR